MGKVKTEMYEPLIEKAYDEGAKAAKDGGNYTACPYSYRWEHQQYDAWMDGFEDHAADPDQGYQYGDA